MRTKCLGRRQAESFLGGFLVAEDRSRRLDAQDAEDTALAMIFFESIIEPSIAEAESAKAEPIPGWLR
jgi:hypothetical protein